MRWTKISPLMALTFCRATHDHDATHVTACANRFHSAVFLRLLDGIIISEGGFELVTPDAETIWIAGISGVMAPVGHDDGRCFLPIVLTRFVVARNCVANWECVGKIRVAGVVELSIQHPFVFGVRGLNGEGVVDCITMQRVVDMASLLCRGTRGADPCCRVLLLPK